MDKSKKNISPKKKKSDLEYPDIIPFSGFSPISILCPPQDFVLHCPPQFIPKRIFNPPTEKDQMLLPLPKKPKIKKNNMPQKKDVLFHFSSKELPSTTNIIPDFDAVKPISAQAFVSTDGVHVIQYRQPKIIDLLTPHLKTNSSRPKQRDDISFPQTHVSLSFDETPIKYEDYINYLFKSVIAPSQHIEDFDVSLAKPPLRNQKGPQPPIPTVPPFTNISLVDSTISSFEKLNLDPSHCNVYDTDFKATFTYTLFNNKPRYITNSSYLSLLEGEYVVIECIDKCPIIRPIIGMSAQLNVIINASPNFNVDDPEKQHPYDTRIPVTQITSTSIQPFMAPIPKDTYVLQMSTSVSSSAISPHKSRSTDFILVADSLVRHYQGNDLYLLPMPDQTYLSTSPESTVVIPNPKSRKIDSFLNQFFEDPLPSAEELCKIRSTVEGLLDLTSKGIERYSLPQISHTNSEKLSTFPPRMRALVGQYMRNLRGTPWNRSRSIVGARLGLKKSIAEIINADPKNNNNSDEKIKASKERKKILSESFENNLLFIKSNPDNENDMMMDLSFMDVDEEEDWNEILDDLELDEVKQMENDPVISKTKIDWEALGLGNLPMRKVMKVIDCQLVDDSVISNVRWVRDPNEIRDNQKKGKSRK